MSVQGGVERVKADLEKEEKDLIHMKEAIQQRLKVLQVYAQQNMFLLSCLSHVARLPPLIISLLPSPSRQRQ